MPSIARVGCGDGRVGALFGMGGWRGGIALRGCMERLWRGGCLRVGGRTLCVSGWRWELEELLIDLMLVLDALLCGQGFDKGRGHVRST